MSNCPWPPLLSPLTTSIALFLPKAMRVYIRRRWYLHSTSSEHGSAWFEQITVSYSHYDDNSDTWSSLDLCIDLWHSRLGHC